MTVKFINFNDVCFICLLFPFVKDYTFIVGDNAVCVGCFFLTMNLSQHFPMFDPSVQMYEQSSFGFC